MKLKAPQNAGFATIKTGAGSKFNPVKGETMKVDWATIVIAICLAAWFISHNVLLPMFNAYLEYRRDIRMHEQDLSMYQVQLNEKGLQRNIDEPDIKQGSGQSDEGTPVHDEELPL